MAKLDNEKKYEYFERRKYLRYIIIVIYLMVVVLAICSLIYNISCLYPLALFIIATLLTKYRDSIDFRDKNQKTSKKTKK